MNVPPWRKSAMASLCASAVVKGSAEPPIAVEYCAPSIRKP